MAKSPSIRFGLGWPDGLRSSSWKVHAGGDSSVYVENRDVGRAMKFTRHPPEPKRTDRESRIAWTSEYVAAGRLPEGQDRVVLDWPSADGRLTPAPLTELFAVVLGRFSMGLHPPPANDVERSRWAKKVGKVDWISDIPPPDSAWQFTVLAGDPGYNVVDPLGAIPVDNFRTSDGSDVWVVRHLIPVTEADVEQFSWAAQSMAAALGKPESATVYRSHILRGTATLRSFTELAVTYGAADADLVVPGDPAVA